MKTQLQKPARGKASYNEEYKQQALELWRNSGRSAAKVAAELGIRRPGCAAARVAVWLLPVVLWHDTVLCLVTRLWFTNFKPEQYDRILVVWRLVTEPLVWILMILLAGWLLDLVRARWREVRAGG